MSIHNTICGLATFAILMALGYLAGFPLPMFPPALLLGAAVVCADLDDEPELAPDQLQPKEGAASSRTKPG